LTVSCRRCGDQFEKRTIAIYCPPCRPLADKERQARYAAAHPAARLAASRKWRLTHPEQHEAAGRAWREANMDRVRGYRRAVKQRLAYYGGRCWMCGSPGETQDHVKPLSKGGAHMLANIRPACLTCNSRKCDRWPLQSLSVH